MVNSLMTVEFTKGPYQTKDYEHEGRVYLRVIYRNLKGSGKVSIGEKIRYVKRATYIPQRHD